MKKTRQAFLLVISLLHIFLCLSFQARVTEARHRLVGEARILTQSKPSICVRPSPPCGASPSSQARRPCITVPRPPRRDRCSPPNS